MAHSNQSVGLFKERKREKVVIIYKQRDEHVYFIFSYNGYLHSIQNFKLKALEYVFLLTFYDNKEIRQAYHHPFHVEMLCIEAIVTGIYVIKFLFHSCEI